MLLWAGMVHFKDSLGYNGLKPTQTSSSEWQDRIYYNDVEVTGYGSIIGQILQHIQSLQNCGFFNED